MLSVNRSPDAAGLPTATVILKPKRARPFFGRHPWVLDSAVQRARKEHIECVVQMKKFWQVSIKCSNRCV